MHREDLAHEQPGDGAEAQREGDDVAAQATQRQPRGLLPVAVEEAHAARAHAQPAERDQQQRPPACAVHEYHRHGRHQHLHAGYVRTGYIIRHSRPLLDRPGRCAIRSW